MRSLVYLCVFGLLGGCHAFIDPEDDYLRPEDAGTPPMNDAGTPPGDSGLGDVGTPDVPLVPDANVADVPSMVDAGPMVDGGPVDAGPTVDAGPALQCTDVDAFNRDNMEILLACCLESLDCPPPMSGMPDFSCINESCATGRAGVCLPTGQAAGIPCRSDVQCASGTCSGGAVEVGCGEVVGRPTGVCE